MLGKMYWWTVVITLSVVGFSAAAAVCQESGLPANVAIWFAVAAAFLVPYFWLRMFSFLFAGDVWPLPLLSRSGIAGGLIGLTAAVAFGRHYSMDFAALLSMAFAAGSLGALLGAATRWGISAFVSRQDRRAIS